MMEKKKKMEVNTDMRIAGRTGMPFCGQREGGERTGEGENAEEAS